MEHSRLTFLLLLANILILGASSNLYDDFHECLTDQFRRSNSATDIIYTPQNSTYTTLLLAQNLRPQSTSPERPDLIVTPYHESEVLAAIYCSKKLGMQIRVRSGGHDYEGLSYTSEIPFVMVDMRNFRTISIDSEDKTAWIQVGATLGQVYYTLAQKSKTLAFPAGVCPTVGVGGHFSGGGYGMMSRKNAIAADHIIDAKLINADGKILDRRTMGEDLFWAIRGGGGTSFGIIVEFKVSLVTIPEIVTVFNVTRTSERSVTQLVDRWQHIADKVDENLLLRLFLAPVRSSTGNVTIAASFTSLYLGPISDLLPLMKEQFPELGLVKEDCIEMSWIESTLFFAGLSDQPLEILLDRTPQGLFSPSYFKGKSDYVSSPIPVNGLREIWKILYEEENSQLQFSPYGGVLNTFSESETPFPHRKGNIFMIHYGVGWVSLNESQQRIDWMRKLYSFMGRYVTKSPRAAYFNYRDLDIGRNNIKGTTSYNQASVWGLKYFKNNFRRLVRVKTKVDPSNFFRNEQSVPPLSSK
ncbi:hypothetical protein ACS0TY_018769 [Phlomoides rotata]